MLIWQWKKIQKELKTSIIYLIFKKDVFKRLNNYKKISPLILNKCSFTSGKDNNKFT